MAAGRCLIALRLTFPLDSAFFTPPEATNMGPGFNRGSGGGARGCGFEERVGAYARTEEGLFPIAHGLCLSVCLSSLHHKSGSWSFQIETKHTLPRPIFKHAQHTHAAPMLPLGDTPNTRALPRTLALSVGRSRC